MTLAAMPWLAVLRARVGGLAAVSIVALSGPALVLAVMLSAPITGTPLEAMVFGAIALAAATGLAVWLRDRHGRNRHDGPLPRLLVPAVTGAIAALGTFVGSRFHAGSPRVSWAMLGDSASQLVRARLILSDGGLSAAPTFDSVPLPPAIIAAVAAPGRHQKGAGELLSHDLNAYATTWAALMVVICLLAGAVGYAIVRRSSELPATLKYATIAATSLIPLGWFWTGYPVKFGFINAHVVLILLFASILGYLGTLRRPGVGLAIQALAVVLVLLTWSPLAVLPAALALTQALDARHSFYRWPRSVRIAVVVAATLGLAYALCLVVASLAAVRASLSTPGGLAEFPKGMLPAAAALLLALTLATPRAARAHGPGFVALCLASVVGLLAVLALSGSVTGTWSYYPHKYAWTAAALLLVIAPPQAACAISRLGSGRLQHLLYGALAVTLAVSLGFGSWWAPGRLELLRGNLPFLILVEDDLPDEGQSPDAVADAVSARVGLPRLTVPWESSLANDYRAGFWLIQLRREEAVRMQDTETADALWTLANFHDSPAELCTLASLVPEGLTVQTSNEELSSQIDAQCPTADLTIERAPASD